MPSHPRIARKSDPKWAPDPEERVLLAKFGAAYSEYVAHVRRWL
jgi:hypothetical protein